MEEGNQSNPSQQNFENPNVQTLEQSNNNYKEERARKGKKKIIIGFIVLIVAVISFIAINIAYSIFGWGTIMEDKWPRLEKTLPSITLAPSPPNISNWKTISTQLGFKIKVPEYYYVMDDPERFEAYDDKKIDWGDIVIVEIGGREDPSEDDPRSLPWPKLDIIKPCGELEKASWCLLPGEEFSQENDIESISINGINAKKYFASSTRQLNPMMMVVEFESSPRFKFLSFLDGSEDAPAIKISNQILSTLEFTN